MVLDRVGESVRWEEDISNRHFQFSFEIQDIDDGVFNGIRNHVLPAPAQRRPVSVPPKFPTLIHQIDYRSQALDAIDVDSISRVVFVDSFLPLCVLPNVPLSIDAFMWDFSVVRGCLQDLPRPKEKLWIGLLPLPDVSAELQPRLRAQLLEKFNCIPVFLPSGMQSKFYDRFCRMYLRPVFYHQIHEPTAERIREYDGLMEAYREANRAFARVVLELIRDTDVVWIFNIELMLLPSLLKQKSSDAAIGFWFHTPFPSSEVFR